MIQAIDTYVEERNNDYYIRGLRIRLSQIVEDWLNGQDPDMIAMNYAALTNGQVYEAIAFYLSHREALDAQFKEAFRREEAVIASYKANRPKRLRALHARMDALKAREATNAT